MSIKALDIVRPTKETWPAPQNIPLLSQQIVGRSSVVNFYSMLMLYQLASFFFFFLNLFAYSDVIQQSTKSLAKSRDTTFFFPFL